MMLALCMDGALLGVTLLKLVSGKGISRRYNDILSRSSGGMCSNTRGYGEDCRDTFRAVCGGLLLQLRCGFHFEAFAKVNEDGGLDLPGHGLYHLTHLAVAVLKRVKRKVYERDIVLFLYGIETAFALYVIIMYF